MPLRVNSLAGFNALPTAAAVSTGPLAVDFNGVDNEITRTSDFTGNADGKVFTFNAWVYPDGSGSGNRVIYASGTSLQFRVHVDTNNKVVIFGENTAGTTILNATSSIVVPDNTFSHVLVSMDMANTGNRDVVINDVVDTGVVYTTYTNANLNFTNTTHDIGSSGGTLFFPGRITHPYLEYIYLAMTIESNRRIFNQISETQGLVPVTEAALTARSPIMYYPLTDPATVLVNKGTGGDANTVGGTFALSQRGPNQFGAVGSVREGTTATRIKKLSTLTGIANSKAFTFSTVFNVTEGIDDHVIFMNEAPENVFAGAFSVLCSTVAGSITITGSNTSGTVILSAVSDTKVFAGSSTNTLQIAINLADTAERFVILNGRVLSMTWTTYTDNEIRFATLDELFVGGQEFFGETGYAGNLGESWFHHSYIAIDVDNPFIDENNRAKYLGETGDLPLGSDPVWYLPCRADNPGVNLGGGGDFATGTLPYPGMRGGSEFWSRSATTAAGVAANIFTNYLSRSGLVGGSSTMGAFTLVQFAYNRDVTLSNKVATLSMNGSGSNSFRLAGASSENAELIINGTISGSVVDGWIPVPEWRTAFATRDGSNNTRLKIEGNVGTSSNVNTVDATGLIVIGSTSGDDDFRDTTGFLYFVDSFIDMSVTANELLFIDGLGFPRDLTQAITNGDIPVPLMLMTYEDPDALGANHVLATGGGFTITGNIEPGRDCLPEFSA